MVNLKTEGLLWTAVYALSVYTSDLKADSWTQIGVYSRNDCPRHGSGKLFLANSEWSGDVVVVFLILFLKSIDTFF